MSQIETEKKNYQPLEILEKRPNPKPFSQVNVQFKNKDTYQLPREFETIEQDEEDEEEEKEKSITDPFDDFENLEKTVPKTNKKGFIIDKRRNNLINRNLILERIFKTKEVEDVTVKKDTVIKEQNEPGIEFVENDEIIKPVRKLIIKPTLPVVEEKEEMETEKRVIKPTKLKLKIKPQEMTDNLDKVDLTKEIIRTQKVSDRLPKEKDKVIMKTSSYYMNNRKIFVEKMNTLFQPYARELYENNDKVSCGKSNSNTFELLTHQKVVRDYLNIYTPYRGLLLYHGLGSGKTCTSIAIAEGMKSNKPVFVMTPASLRSNFFSELKKCGDDMFKKNQYWEFIRIEGKPDFINVLAKALSLSTAYVRKNGGAWLLNINKEPNYDTLTVGEQEQLDDQLNEMILVKYKHKNYNGLNENQMKELTGNGTRNPFDNHVIVIDEAHNFVSRIVNRIKDKKSISYRLYEYLLTASNVKIVMLTGTPIINYPNEVAVLFNILRGYITTWTIPIEWEKNEKMDSERILKMLDDGKMKTFDQISYSDNKIVITRNPFGFVNTKKRGVVKGTRKKEKTEKKMESETMLGGNLFDKYNGVKLDDSGNLTNNDFLKQIINVLKKNGVKVLEKQIKIVNNKCLHDTPDEFQQNFVDVDTENAKNINLLQRRILGLVSYFKSAQEELLPDYVENEEGDIYHVVKTEMTDHQFSIYEKIRKDENDKEKKSKLVKKMKKGDELLKVSSTYRIFSRAACNFVFPSTINRPIPNMKDTEEQIDESIVDALSSKQSIDLNYNVDESEEKEKSIDEKEEKVYMRRIEKAMSDLNANKENSDEKMYLSKDELINYSPKFAKVLENLANLENEGLHLVYSHFRTIEGIGILKLILLANGFAEFKIKKTDGVWAVDEKEEDKDKPKFVLYTGTETVEEKEIIRNIYNSMWTFVPSSIVDQLKVKNENNFLGEIIKVMMITSSGAEGINLKNTRFVHVVEPYWHMVRIEQVVGRARRICSHEDLPVEMRNVKIFLYVSTLSEKQKTDQEHIELIIRDTSRVDKKTPITTDESLYELASIKQRINNQILRAIKETAIDCNLYSKNNKEEDLVCYGFGKVESNAFSSYPSFEEDKKNKEGLDVKKVMWKGQIIKENGIEYVLNPATNEVYDYNSYKNVKEGIGNLILIGKIVKKGNKQVLEKM